MPTSSPPPSPPPAHPPADGLLRAALRNLREIGHALSHPSHPPTPLLSGAPKRWQRLLPYVVVVALAAVFIPVTITVLKDQYGLSGGIAGALGVAQAAPLLMLAHRPLEAWWIIFPADVLGAIVLLVQDAAQNSAWPWTPPGFVSYLFLLLALSLRERRRTLIGVWLAPGVAGLVLYLVSSDRGDNNSILLMILGAVVLVIGTAVRERGDAQRLLAEQETINEAERAQRTLLEERTRIARELHDVVAHHMSVITVQADSAPYRLQGLSDEAREEFGSIAASARESLTEMRRLLTVLRSAGTEGERAPQPGLDRVQQLVEATVRAGLPAELSLPAGLKGVPPAVDLSAYRIVQEALANVMRHAPGARTRVSISSDGAHLTVLVVNDPPEPTGSSLAPRTPVETTGTGHGLVGMRERVRLTGGTLDTGPLPDGGFRVAARLPLPPASAPSASLVPPSNPEHS
ncbi:sensor histidine kinase [Streptomyces sp. NPDC050529]|uniref:sensor histidine kinase n=1 Tax=unclassified Streptomyces TaxID=2593676 RepID=UPI002DDC52C9|nr:sensor histidine kinase [Streptomyces sp. NBC_01022]WRZ81565.1 sensor histidine kinase [Streptomyces sp. NBC_01022]